MKSIRSKLCFWLIASVSFFFPLFAGAADDQNEPLPEPLSMTEAIHIAVEQNPEIKAARFSGGCCKIQLGHSPVRFLPPA